MMGSTEPKFPMLNAFMKTARTQCPLEDPDLCSLKNKLEIKYIVFPLILISLIEYV